MWIITILGSILGGLGLAVSIFATNGAPQEAAGAAISIGLAVIPYVFARALTIPVQSAELVHIRKLLETIAKGPSQ